MDRLFPDKDLDRILSAFCGGNMPPVATIKFICNTYNLAFRIISYLVTSVSESFFFKRIYVANPAMY
ncbi:MAG TPA: hypothetical protein PLM81_11325 [Ginsengibacter sp.]|nr:hypothetical protein [Ginsengibacter sp.]HRP17694.1 hypothetical protein [Ginsengibacter sp.]HRP45240.1 hypothetical protein [Ginsengibacter sp.]